MSLHGKKWMVLACMSLLLIGSTACDCDSAVEDQPLDTLCPDVPPAGMELCISFETLVQGLGESDVGGLELEVTGGGELVEGREGVAIGFSDDTGGVTVEGFSFTGQQLTVEAWVKPEGEQVHWATIVDWWYDFQGFWLGGSDVPGGWEFWNGRALVEDPDGLVQGQWQHLAGVLDGEAGTLALYINGVEMHRIEGAPVFEPPPGIPLSIGARGDRSDFFLGVVDEVMIWSRVRTAEEICADGGGTWQADGCGYDQPVGDPPGPCEGVDCSGHGTCELEGGQSVCNCDPGYHAEGLDCLEDYDPCVGIDTLITEWVDWYLAGLEAGLESEVQAFVDSYESGNSAWDPQAEAWSSAAILALLHNSQEVFCLGMLKAVEIQNRRLKSPIMWAWWS